MCREHFTVSIDIDPFALCLLQKELQIMQIMTGNNDKRSLFHGQRNRNRYGCPIAFGVRLIQKRHAFQVFLSYLHNNRQKLIHPPVLSYYIECPRKESVHFFIRVAQYQRMMCIGCHAAHTEKDEGFETADILLCIPDILHGIIIALSAKPFRFLMHLIHAFT